MLRHRTMINYKKLAQAIIQENKKMNCDEITKAIINAEKHIQDSKKKQDYKQNKFRIELMKFINGCIYIMLAIIAATFLFNLWKGYVYTGLSSLAENVAVSIILVLVAVFSFLSQQESLEDNVQNAILHFNSNIALVALIVAVIALLKNN